MAVRRMLFEQMTPEDEVHIAVSSEKAREVLEASMVEHYPFGEADSPEAELIGELQRSLYFLLRHLPGTVELQECETIQPLQRCE